MPRKHQQKYEHYRWESDLSRSQLEHQKRGSTLAKLDKLYIQRHGPNISLGKPSDWSEYPRRGAYWSNEENDALIHGFYDRVREDGRKMGLTAICAIAHEHGRTAVAIESRLLTLLGHEEYYEHVHFETPGQPIGLH